MASFHPGVKSLIDRVLKQQPSNDKKKLNDPKLILNDIKSNPNDKKLLDKKLNQNGIHNKYSIFKNILQDRMKDRRRRQREEEEEEDKLNEEYHDEIKEIDEECTKSTSNNDEDKENNNNDDDDDDDDEDDDNDDEEEVIDDDDDDDDDDDGSFEKSCNSNNDDFKLNLDDDEDDDDIDKKKKKNSKSKKNDELFDCDDILNYKKNNNEKKQTSNDMIPASIPSNQLTSNSSIKIKQCKNNVYDFDCENNDDDESTTQRTFRLYIDSTDQKKEQNEEDIECISLNFENVNNSLNNQNADLSSNTTANNTINSGKLNLSENNNDLLENECNGVDFDELAMLCSGNFKPVEVKKTINSEIKCIIEEKIDEENDSNSNENIAKKLTKEKINDESSNDSVTKKNDEESIRKECDKNDILKNDDLYDHEDADEDVVEEDDDDDDDDDDVQEEKITKKSYNDEIEYDNGYVKDARKEFFENEAELSGSEADSDENFDGESDEELVCSGDEDQLPSDSELKSELEKIYLKDQIDEDKRQIRMFKERYLADGEFHQDKGFRKKNFRWKNLNDNRFNNNNYSSDDDEDEEDESDVDENTEKKTLKFENGKFNNWRKTRHEREQFVNSKRNREDLISSDEESNDKLDDNSQKGLILKIGQNLLKTKLNKTPEEETVTIDLTTQSTITTTTTINGSSQTATNTQQKSVLEKFSFLKKDKAYLNRISSYVNKTLNLNNGLKSDKSDFKMGKNMVFSRLTQEQNDDKTKKNDEKISDDEIPIIKSVNILEPSAKRPKFEKTSNNTESIFNLL